ncbi:MAG TPA: S41 family peptidase [Candidatus Methylomirabilis sp.]|nr:S41 family peptidase [Candidatus Methylomirabilis sp.]
MRSLRTVCALACVSAIIFVLRATGSATANGPLAQGEATASPALPSFSEPGVSPDAKEIAFVSGGDIWTVPASGGEARLLISHPATESRPLYSPDGKRLAFVSNRTGNGDVYALTFATSAIERLTYDDAPEQVSAWSRDSRWIYFSSTSHDISGMNDIYRVSATGGTPMPVSADVYANEFFGAPSPDGSTLAFSARGTASAQWWRKGRSHLDEAEIWLMHDGATPSFQRFTEPGAKELWPMWSADGKALYYVSDRNGQQNIWMRPLDANAKQLTQFTDGRVLWPSISADGRVIVFERKFGIWKLDTATGAVGEVHTALRGAPAGPGAEHVTLSNQFHGLALSLDGKKVAFTARGQIFAASSKEESAAFRVTHADGEESSVVWAPDSKRIVYVSDRQGSPHLFEYDFATNVETQLTRDALADNAPRFSPDGKELLFERGARELRILDMAEKKERPLTAAKFDPTLFTPDHPYCWSPDGRWIAFLQYGERGFQDVYVIPSKGGSAEPISFLSDTNADGVSWSTDGTAIYFTTGQRTEQNQIARIDLIPREPKFHEDQFRDLFKEEPAKPSAPAERKVESKEPEVQEATEGKKSASSEEAKKKPVKPVEIAFDGIRRRLHLLPTGIDANDLSISPDGKSLLLRARVAGQTNLYTYSIDELAKEPPVARQLTSTAAPKDSAQFSPDGKEIFFLEQGRIQVMTVESRTAKPLAVTAELDVDFAREKEEMFWQVWSDLRDTFFDPNFNGVDWNAVRTRYTPRIAGAATPDEVRRLLNLMVGELNASHSGVGAPPGSTQTVTGRLAVNFDRSAYEKDGRLRIAKIIPLGPAALAKEIHEGDDLLAVDGQTVRAGVNLDALLEHKIDKRVVLTVKGSSESSAKHDVVVRPVNLGTEKNLRYRAWVEERRAYVEKESNGRLGYVHMPDMSAQSLAQLYVDLDAQNQGREGVVIDIRNNNGGFVNVYAIDVLARRPYLTMTVRGLAPAPARTQLGQRALERPTILVTNQHSLSDAEDFTEGYRALHLGKVVGEPTAGWIIYTSGAALVDGSTVRIPFIRITAADGTPMEMHPRPVDVPVTRPIGESYTGKDTQLDAAVHELLQQLGSLPK